jgi:hypothetical protein
MVRERLADSEPDRAGVLVADARITRVLLIEVWSQLGDEVPMFDFLLVGFSLAPLGLLLLFWRVFPHDRGLHPIYRDFRMKRKKKNRSPGQGCTRAIDGRRRTKMGSNHWRPMQSRQRIGHMRSSILNLLPASLS